jgi:hypothetical protein
VGRFFLVMELIKGVDLRTLIRSGPLPIAVSTFVAGEVLRGLDYAHSMEHDGRRSCIVHRDISPHNIMLSWQGAVKVVDFGIAKAIEGSMVSRSGSLKGKVSYMSPEQVHGKQIDGRSDLFALGIVLYEILSNSRLFVGKTDAETLSLLLTKPFPRCRELNPEVPEDLDAVVMRLLERDRNRRYTTALEAVEDLASCSTASARARLDLESLLVARFPDQAPARGRHSSVPPLGNIDAMGATLEAPRRAAEGVPQMTAETVKGHGRAPSRPLPSRTMTAASVGARAGGQGVPAGWVANLSEQERTASRRWMWIALPLILFAGVVGIAVFAGSEDAGDSQQAALPAAPPASPADADGEASNATSAAAVDAGLARALDAATRAVVEAATRDEEKRDESEPAMVKLSVKVVPWAEIELDGKKRGQTPQTFHVKPGKHKLRLRNPDMKAERTIRFRMKPEKDKSISLDWLKDPPP